jgi:glycosyltransferase involved in cell wall biosynthesis
MSEPIKRPAVASSQISVLLFAHALGTDTQEALQGWRQYLDTLRRPYEIILIQETRPEASPHPADERPDLAKPTRIFSYDRTLGFRDALNEAIRSVQHPLLVFCPADKQYAPGDLERMFKMIDEVDMVVGYRTGGQAPPWRVALDMLLGLLSRILLGVPLEPRGCWLSSEGWGRRWIARWIFGVRVTDPECPFRLARRELFDRLPIQSGGPFVQVEILAKANHLSCYLAETPLPWTPPVLPTGEAISFGQDARLVFRDPDFGPLQIANSALPKRALATDETQINLAGPSRNHE